MTRKEEIKQMIRETFRKHLGDDGYRVFIFGSQANLPELRRSNIDVGVEIEKKYDCMLLNDIKHDLELLPTLFWFDVIDFKTAKEKFRNLASQNIEMI